MLSYCRWIYIVSTDFYIVFTVVCGVSNSLGFFFVMRLLQGFAGSVGMAGGGGTVVDLFTPHESGRYMGIYMAT